MAPVPSLRPLRLYGPSAISSAFAPLWPQCHLFGLCAFIWPQCHQSHLFGLCAFLAPVPSLWPLRLYGPSAISSAFAPLWPQCHLFGLCAFLAPVPSLWPLRLYGPSAISLAFALLWPQCRLFGLCAFMAPVPSLWPLRLFGPSAISLTFAPLYGPSAISPISLAFAPLWPQRHLFDLCAFMAVAPSHWPLRLYLPFYGPSAISLAFASLYGPSAISPISLAFALLWPQCHLFGLCASMVPVPSLWPFAPPWSQCHLFGPLHLFMAPVPSLWPCAPVPSLALCAFMVLLAPFLWPSCLCGHLPWPFAPLWPRTISSAFKPFWPQQFLWPWRLFGPSVSLTFALVWSQCHLFGLCALCAPAPSLMIAQVPSLWLFRLYG